jgi:CHASE2 domain-containing sensor protein
MLPARWSLVVVLGALTVLAVGLVHAEHRRARAIAVGLVSFGIACCFLVLFLHARPFLGVLALNPTELSALVAELAGL